LSALASVEVQLVMRFLDAGSKTRMAVTCKRLRRDAAAEFAWKGTLLFLTQPLLFKKHHFLGSLVSASRTPLILCCDDYFTVSHLLSKAHLLWGLDAASVSNGHRAFLQLLERRSPLWQLQWMRLPHVLNRMDDNRHIVFYRKVFDGIAQSFTQLRTLIMPHEYPKLQIEGLLETHAASPD
jgi:hypothetical protein